MTDIGLMPRIPVRQTDRTLKQPSRLERFICGIAYGQMTPEGCLPWGGKPTAQGYGVFGENWTLTPAHVVAYELFVGPIPDGYVIDHLCRNRICVEPSHLEAVTRAENIRRGAGNGMALFTYKCQDPTHHRVPRYEKGRQYGTRCAECTRAQNTERMRAWKRANRAKVDK